MTPFDPNSFGPVPAGFGGPVFNPMSFGAYGDGQHDDGPAFGRMIESVPTNGALITITRPHFIANSGIVKFDGRSGVVMQGISGLSAGVAVPAYLTFGATDGGSCISARDTLGFVMRDLSVYALAAGYSGVPIDLSGAVNTAYAKLENMTIFGGAAVPFLVDANNVSTFECGLVFFSGGVSAIRGIKVSTSATDFSNGGTIKSCKFSGQSSYQVVNPGTWTFDCPTVERLNSGAAGFMRMAAPNWSGVNVNGGWYGDVTASGIWVAIAATGGGFNWTGFEVGGSGAAGGVIGVDISAACAGVNVAGGKFDALQTAVNIGAVALTDSGFVADTRNCGVAAVVNGGATLTRVNVLGVLHGYTLA